MQKEKIIGIVDAMGFKVESDQWEEKGWVRFRFKKEVLNKMFIWYKNDEDKLNFASLADVIFQCGQIKKLNDINKIENI